MAEELGGDFEIIEYAIAREVEANKFYLAWARRTKNPEIRAILEEFAEEELEHKAKLELEIMKLGKVVVLEDTVGDFESSEPLLDSSGFELDYRGLLEIAVQKEKASFRHYVYMAGIVHDEDSLNIILGIAEEEVKHKMRFEFELEKLQRAT